MCLSAKWLLPLLILGCGFTLGCGSGEAGRIPLSGTATFGGEPIPYGEIEFAPEASGTTKEPAGYATVMEGKFTTSNGGRGVVPGGNRVIVYGFDAKPGEVPSPEYRVPLFEPYEFRSEFSVGQSEFNIDVPRRSR